MENVHYYMHQNININDTYIEIVLNHLLSIIHNSTSWRNWYHFYRSFIALPLKVTSGRLHQRYL